MSFENRSPYAAFSGEFVQELNNVFIAYFGLLSEYQYEGINDGDRYGLISIRSLETNKQRKAGSQVRGGFQFLVFKLDILFTLGCSSRINAESLAAEWMLNLHHGIPALKKMLNSTIFDLQSDESFTCVKRQATKPPHNWIIDLTCEATADLAIKVDQMGTHSLLPKEDYGL